MAAFVKFWGTRGSIPTPASWTRVYGGNTSCVEVRFEDTVFICGAGSGIREMGKDLMDRKPSPQSLHLLITHTHWDHIQGFPFFAPLFLPDNRFKVYGPEGAHLSLRDVLAGQMEHHYFPVELDQLAARISYQDLCEGSYEIDGMRVRAQQMNHPSPTLGYRIEAEGRCICYLCDHEPFCEDVWREGAPRGKFESILEDGDRRHAEYMQGADVVIHEAQYTPQEYPSKRHWGHSTYVYVVELAVLAGVSRLYLTHHDPTHDDEFVADVEKKAQELARSLNSKLEVCCAYEGCEITV